MKFGFVNVVVFIAVVLGLQGCANVTAKIDYGNFSKGSSFELVDRRTEEQRNTGNVSLNVMNCSYASLRIGDVDITPSRLAMLKNDLEMELGSELAGKNVYLENYVIHLNRAAATRGMLKSTYGTGLITELMNDTRMVGCADDDLDGGYRVSELKTPYSPLIVVIDVTVDEKKYHSRWVQSAKEELPTKGKKWNTINTTAIKSATINLIKQMKN